MSSPHYISEDQSDMRGIKPGWYAIDDDGKLSSGPFSDHEECLRRVRQPTNGSPDVYAPTAEVK
jgi:hypothetical protein